MDVCVCADVCECADVTIQCTGVHLTHVSVVLLSLSPSLSSRCLLL